MLFFAKQGYDKRRSDVAVLKKFFTVFIKRRLFEKALFDAVGDHEPIAKLFFEKGEYEGMLASLTPLKAPVDAFFADVMVNAEDEKLRLNRLALLTRLYKLMNRVAELSRLAL